MNGENNANSVFVFQAGSTLITASSSRVQLINGAQACNVWWQVGSSATLGTATTFVGSILALTSASLSTGATVAGRVLARNGAVTLDDNTITAPTCSSGGTTTSTTTGTGGSSGGKGGGGGSGGSTSKATPKGGPTNAGGLGGGTNVGGLGSGVVPTGFPDHRPGRSVAPPMQPGPGQPWAGWPPSSAPSVALGQAFRVAAGMALADKHAGNGDGPERRTDENERSLDPRRQRHRGSEILVRVVGAVRAGASRGRAASLVPGPPEHRPSLWALRSSATGLPASGPDRAGADGGRPPLWWPDSAPVSPGVPAIARGRSTCPPWGSNPTGRSQVPGNDTEPGWFRLGPTPGQVGSAVILGHVDTYQGPGVFFDLRTLLNGDQVQVSLADGAVVTFAVTSVVQLREGPVFPANR